MSLLSVRKKKVIKFSAEQVNHCAHYLFMTRQKHKTFLCVPVSYESPLKALH
jgi:hypothetical protein